MIFGSEAGVFGARNEDFAVVFQPERMKIFSTGAAKRMVQTIQKNIRVTPEQWKRIENEAEKREMSPNRLVVELVMEALERREWPRTEVEIHLLRSAMFTAQAIIRYMEKAGREEEISQISRNISEVAPELPVKNKSLITFCDYDVPNNFKPSKSLCRTLKNCN